jgi:hypothetical protein
MPLDGAFGWHLHQRSNGEVTKTLVCRCLDVSGQLKTKIEKGKQFKRLVTGKCLLLSGQQRTAVRMFANMTDPSKLGPFMATALLATLYGAVLANIICLPIADKLHGKLVDEEINRTLIIDGVLMIRESKSPTLVREMLVAYLPEKHRSEEPEPVAA